jgi:hypothetical protein
MDKTLSYLISAGIIAFGILIVASPVVVGSSAAWTLTGLLPLVVGSISLYQVISSPG